MAKQVSFQRITEGSDAVFRIYPEGKSRLFWLVCIWPTLKAMHAAVPDVRPADWRGICSCYRIESHKKGKKPRLLPELGCIHLCRKHLQVGVLTHECAHAAIAWARRARLPHATMFEQEDGWRMGSPEEERLAHVTGELMRQLVLAIYQLNFLTEGKES